MYQPLRKAIKLETRLDSLLHGKGAAPLYSIAILREQFFNQPFSFLDAPTGCMSKACQEVHCIVPAPSDWKWSTQHVHPEIDATLFYLVNQYHSVLKNKFSTFQFIIDDLHSPIVRMSMQALVRLQLRSFYYLTVICTRESRHSHSTQSQMKEHLKSRGVPEKWAEEFSDFFSDIRGKSSHDAQKMFYASDMDIPFGWYTRCLVDAFDTPFNSAYGGKAWKNIAECLNSAVWGKTSLITMVDTAYTLAHNTGAIFNKGFIYHTQSNAILLKTLDLQRAGALPEAIYSNYLKHYLTKIGTTKEDKESLALIDCLVEAYYDLVPDHKKDIDWANVVALGALGDYSHKVKEQIAAKALNKVFIENAPEYKFKSTMAWHPKKTPITLLKRDLTA